MSPSVLLLHGASVRPAVRGQQVREEHTPPLKDLRQEIGDLEMPSTKATSTKMQLQQRGTYSSSKSKVIFLSTREGTSTSDPEESTYVFSQRPRIIILSLVGSQKKI